MYVDYPVGCYVYSSLTVQSLPKSTILILVFIGPCILNRGQACWLFKDNSKLLFLLIKWLWKRVEIKHLLNIDHTSHFVTTFYFFYFFALPTCFLYCSLLCVSLGFLYLYKSELTKVLYYIFILCCVSVWANDCFCYCGWEGFIGGYVLKIGMHPLISLWSGEPRECSCIQSSHSSCSTLLNLVREEGGGLKRIWV